MDSFAGSGAGFGAGPDGGFMVLDRWSTRGLSWLHNPPKSAHRSPAIHYHYFRPVGRPRRLAINKVDKNCLFLRFPWTPRILFPPNDTRLAGEIMGNGLFDGLFLGSMLTG